MQFRNYISLESPIDILQKSDFPNTILFPFQFISIHQSPQHYYDVASSLIDTHLLDDLPFHYKITQNLYVHILNCTCFSVLLPLQLLLHVLF